MNNHNADKPKRKLWPWFLGGCLLLIVLVVGGIVGVGFWGMGKFGDLVQEGFKDHPAVIEHFGTLESVNMDFQATSQADGQSVVFAVTGSKGKGQIAIPKTEMESMESGEGAQVFVITTPTGEQVEVDPAAEAEVVEDEYYEEDPQAEGQEQEEEVL